MGWGSRTSISNWKYNHIGHFAAAGEALCKGTVVEDAAARLHRRTSQGGVARINGGATNLLAAPPLRSAGVSQLHSIAAWLSAFPPPTPSTGSSMIATFVYIWAVFSS